MSRGRGGAQSDWAPRRACERVGGQRVCRTRRGSCLHRLVGACAKGAARDGTVGRCSLEIRGHLGDCPRAPVGAGARSRSGFPSSATYLGISARHGRGRVFRDSRRRDARPTLACLGALGASGGRLLRRDTSGVALGVRTVRPGSVVRRGVHGRRSLCSRGACCRTDQSGCAARPRAAHQVCSRAMAALVSLGIRRRAMTERG